jgi:hypothetical protein
VCAQRNPDGSMSIELSGQVPEGWTAGMVLRNPNKDSGMPCGAGCIPTDAEGLNTFRNEAGNGQVVGPWDAPSSALLAKEVCCRCGDNASPACNEPPDCDARLLDPLTNYTVMISMFKTSDFSTLTCIESPALGCG